MGNILYFDCSFGWRCLLGLTRLLNYLLILTYRLFIFGNIKIVFALPQNRSIFGVICKYPEITIEIIIKTINQLNKIYLNQNRRIIKYCRFQFLSLSLDIRWIKWRKVRVSMYVKVLHSPIIIFYWNFFSKELLNLYFTTAIKRDSVKTSLKHILQAYL